MITWRDQAVSYPIFEVLIEDSYHLTHLRKTLRVYPRMILDIGAHVGSASVALHSLFPSARVIAVEPSFDAFVLLKRNLAANAVAAEVVQAAVCSRTGTAVLVEDHPGSWATHVAFELEGQASADQVLVRTLTMAELLALCPEGPILVKLDCEGCEYEIFDDIADDSWNNVCAVLLEYHNTVGKGNWPWLRQRFVNLGFTVLWHSNVQLGQGLACLIRQ